ncbi:MAG: tetratricopeptide repeat protein [Planctomycetota bacterium]
MPRSNDRERPSVRTPRVDPGKVPDRRRIDTAPKRPSGTNREPKVVDDTGRGEQRVRIVRLDEGSSNRRTPQLGPGVTEKKGPTIRYRPDPADDDRPITQSMPRHLPGDAGPGSTSPRRPSGTRARPRVSIGDPGPDGGGGGSINGGKEGKGGKRKKGGQQARNKGGGHKGRGHQRDNRHYNHRDCRCDSCSVWYWGSLWCYAGYRYCSSWGWWPWYGYWPSSGWYGSRYGSWYGYWPNDYGYGYSSNDYVTQPAYTDYADTPYAPVVYAPEPCPRTLAEAWGLLADSRPGEAADAFDCLADAIPDDGLPLVGYALAAALLDEHEVAVANMRAALRTDPETLRFVPEDERLHGQLTQLVEHYEYRARHQYGDLDALFMVASLWYLLNQERAAEYAIDIAITLGDNDPSTVSLTLLIESALK